MASGIRTVIWLAFVLAFGFLLLILSCALWSNWYPLLVALLFVLAPIPNSLCSRLAGYDDYSADYNLAFVDLGNFLTSIMVVSGVALPLALAHAGVITTTACGMSIIGGGLVYSTMVTYHAFFAQEEDNFGF